MSALEGRQRPARSGKTAGERTLAERRADFWQAARRREWRATLPAPASAPDDQRPALPASAYQVEVIAPDAGLECVRAWMGRDGWARLLDEPEATDARRLLPLLARLATWERA